MTHAIRSRPPGIGLTAALMCAFNGLGLVFHDATTTSLLAFAALYGVAAVSFVVIWYYWRGQNWARWLVLVMSVLALLNVTAFSALAITAKVLVLVEAGFGLGMLYWLNTKPVVLYFKSTPRQPSLGRASMVVIGVISAIGVLLVGAMGVSTFLSPTPRPVYGDEITTAHRQALGRLYPGGE